MKRSPLPPSRREVLQWAAAGAALAMLPSCKDDATSNPTPGPSTAYAYRFLTAAEVAALDAMADVALPPDDGRPGGSALGTSVFVDRLLSALEPATGDTPFLLAAGPYSDRNPFPADDGTPSTTLPANGFAQPIVLDRVAAYAWKLYLYGSDGVGGGPNDAITGKVVGLRDQVRTGLAQAMATATGPLDSANVAERARVWAALDADTQDLVINLTTQAAFSAPEYGGNPNRAGWALVHFEGDVQPLGYTLYDATTGTLRERADHPMTTGNPGADPDPLSDDVVQLIDTAVNLLGGKVNR